ncbi:MAG: hypothetical protein ACFFDN_40090 [Candidatus Hodarchaeota archaeon]
MNLRKITKILFIFQILFILCNATIFSRDYQDSWILEGLEIQFVLYLSTYFITFFYEDRIGWLVALASTYSVVMGLIPNFKYVWFLGRSIDQHGQYKLAKEILDHGYISNQFHGGHANLYARIPLIHISFSIFSNILDIDLYNSIKFLPNLISSMFPLVIYSIVKNFNLYKKRYIIKYSLFLSSFIVDCSWSYIITGRTYGVFFIFIIILETILLLKNNDAKHFIIFIFMILTLSLTHSTTSLLISLVFLFIWIIQNIDIYRIKHYMNKQTVFLLIIINITMILFSATVVMDNVLRTILNVVARITPERGYIPLRFFELFNISTIDAVKSIIVYNGADMIFLLLTVIGLIILLKNQKDDKYGILRFIFFFNLFLIISMITGVAIKIGQFFWQRVINFVRISYSILSSIAIVHVVKRKTIQIFILLFIIFFVIIQFYAYQPLIPSANSLSEDFPKDEPVVYRLEVNSIYQRAMIKFSELYVKGRIASDRITINQIMGLTEYAFSRNIMWYNPLTELYYQNVVEREYDYFLIHIPGKSGAFSEPLELRTRKIIVSYINYANIFYTNGESYICKK